MGFEWIVRMRSASCVVPYKNRQACISEGEHVMRNSLFYLSFAFVAASAIAVEFVINKSFRRRAVEIEEEAENLINAGLAKTAESLQELKDRGISWKIREEISNAFENTARVIEKGAELIEGALTNVRI